MKFQITEHILLGNLGDWWKDNREAADAWADFIQPRFVSVITDKIPNAEVEVNFEIQSASGASRGVECYPMDDEAMESDWVGFEEALSSEATYGWTEWSESEEAQDLML